MKNKLKNGVVALVILATLVIQLITLSNNPINHLIMKKENVMDFSITVKVISLDKNPKASNINTRKNVVNFVSETRNSLNVYVPLREGSVPFMGYQFINIKINDEIEIVIKSSREIYYFKNNAITYTHRYENPVFYTGAADANLVNKGNTKLIALDTEYKARPDQEQISGKVFLSIFLLAFCFLIIGAFARKKSEIEENALLSIATRTKILFLLVSISCYALLLAKWFFNERDPVGARNLTPFGPSGPLFSDFFQIATLASFNGVYESTFTNYPPFGILLLKALSNLSLFAVFIMIVFFCAGVLIGNFNFFNKTGILDTLIALTSFPFLFAIARGNLDLLACALVILSMASFKSERNNWAVIFLSVAIALKLWPIVFVLIFLKKGFREPLIIGFTSFVLSVISFIILGHQSFALFFKVILSALFSGNAGTSMEFQNTFSVKTLFVLFHMIFNSKFPISPDKTDFTTALSFANGLYGATILIWLLFFVLFLLRKTDELKYQFFFASSIVLLISSPSYVYRGIILIYAFQLLYREAETHTNSMNLKFFSIDLSRLKIVLWLLIFVPTSFYYFSEKAVSTSSLIAPLSLLILLFIYAEESGGLREFQLFVSKSKESLTSFLAK
jgi:hypothetical protein